MLVPVVLAAVTTALGFAAPPPPYHPSAEELRPIRAQTAELAAAIAELTRKNVDQGLLADVEVYHKAAVWILRYADEEFYAKRYLADTLAVLDRGLARAKELAAGQPSWPQRRGTLVRAYRWRVDGSVQPYGLVIPTGYDARKPVRLDVVLHGRGATLNEVSFIAARESPKREEPALDYIRLDVYGRGNNAYRWAGETDVFEALESVRKRYAIDPRQIVLRGFSMGGAGDWHLGLHYPDRWAAVEAGAGFTDTKRYARLDDLPAYQEPLLHIYDAVDYALNAWNVATVGYGGEDDGQLQGATNIREQLEREGFHFTRDGLNFPATDLAARFLVGPKTGHKFHPESKQQSEQFIQAALAHGRAAPNRIRFVTYTTRYDECFGLRVAALEKHYVRADVDASRSADGKRLDVTTRNVARLVLAASFLTPGTSLNIDGKEGMPAGLAPSSDLVLDKQPGGWTARALAREVWDSPLPLRKTHGRQGPIDDAFADSFLCVRATGTPYHPPAHDYAQATLGRFTREFAKWLRGDVPIKDDTEVTPADIASRHLILFGDPASNKVLEKIASRLPIRWSRDAIVVGGKSFAAADHALAMIYPNPLNPRRYVVLNSGHTFGEPDFRGTNALLFPRLGDYAVLRLARTSAAPADATVELAGLFGECWELTPSAK